MSMRGGAGGPRLLVCIYSCAAHAPLLPRFYASPVGRWIAARPGTRVLEVVASLDVAESRIDGPVLTVRAEERYERLSLKTQAMVEHCVATQDFDALLKIDVTTVLDVLDGPEFAGRAPIDPLALLAFAEAADPCADYAGLLLHAGAGREGAEGWAKKKGGTIDYGRLFGDGPMPPFYSGKCYLLGRRFAEFVAARGAPLAQEHAAYFLGAEDLMIGRLHALYVADPAAVQTESVDG